ncbi:unnamed protein product [Trichobilharzia szidati]|nr:unnamed protein product [Trichobilharzia szidati]CAH8867307.1 unnamed protein product [Trichobilharzia szidati]
MKRDSSGNNQDGPPNKFQRSSVDLTNVSIRFLIPGRAAGIMIGKGGENIKKIRSQYNVKLNIPDSRGPERIMTIEGDLQAICSIMRDVCPKLKDIMNAKLSDPKRIMGTQALRRRGRRSEDPERDEEEDENMIDFRILVHESQAGSVIGRGGERIKDLRDKFKMRVIKVYQMLAPLSTDRVVQMVADPDNVVQCLKAVIEAVESAPPRGRREDYDAANFSESDALNYGGWLSREAAAALAQGMPLRGPGGMPPMGYNMGGPYMMGGGDMGPMGGGMGPMGGGMGPGGGMSPMGGGPVHGGRGRGPRSGGGMMGGNAPPPQSQRGMMGSSGPAPVPPPVGRGGAMGPPGGYGGAADGGYGGPGGYDGPGGFDNGGYGGIDQGAPGGFGGPGYGASGNMSSGGYGGAGYGGGARGASDIPGGQSAPSRGGTYGGYGGMGSGEHVGGKANQWYGGWS